MSNQAKSLAEFVALLDRCKAQVEADPEGYLLNPHLYDLQHRIFLRLCHGDIPEYAIDTESCAPDTNNDEEVVNPTA